MQSLEDFMLPCLNKKLFGVDCMGCGMQRSAVLLVRGEFEAAYMMYPAIYTLILLIGFVVLNYFKNYKFGSKIIIILAILNAVIIIGNFILKTF